MQRPLTVIDSYASATYTEPLSSDAELVALKWWLNDPAFVAQLLKRLLHNDPRLRQAAERLIEEIRRQNLPIE